MRERILRLLSELSYDEKLILYELLLNLRQKR